MECPGGAQRAPGYSLRWSVRQARIVLAFSPRRRRPWRSGNCALAGGLPPGLRWLEALINGGRLRPGGRCDLPQLRCAYVALLAIVERQPENVAERPERALGGVRLGRLDAVLDGLADCGAEAPVAARALAHDLARPILGVDGHAHSGRVGDDDAAFGVVLGLRDLHGLVLPLHLYCF